MASLRIKICGITCLEDALHAADCGADALGFVFHPASPRYVTPAQAATIIAALPPLVTTVGLFVNRPVLEIRAVAQDCGLDVVQLHGDEPAADCGALIAAHRRVVKAVRLRDAASVQALDAYPATAILLDAWVAGTYGGTGQRCDWQLAAEVARRRRVILAGGLEPDNVRQAVQQVAPYGVDVSSGVERVPGRKDPRRVAAFIRNARTLME
jgi:phosphoribosylanthranilate isomerase